MVIIIIAASHFRHFLEKKTTELKLSFHLTPTPRVTAPRATNLHSLVIRSCREALIELAILEP